MASFEFFTLDVFTERRFGGNPLAVFPRATGLNDQQMQELAREFNLSETTFVFPPANPKHTARVRIFTPRAEVPFAGHPNVGTAFVISRLNLGLGDTLVFEEEAGLVEVELQHGPEGRVTGARVRAPQALVLGAAVPVAAVAACAGLPVDALHPGPPPPVFAGVGLGFVLAEVASREALSRAAPDVGSFRAAARDFPEIGSRFQVHLYCRDPLGRRRCATRMFAPLAGVPEDPATGSANAALAALLLERSGPALESLDLEIEQGVDMGRPSRLLAGARRSRSGAIHATIAGGCVPVMRGHAEV